MLLKQVESISKESDWEQIRTYYDALKRKRGSLFLKKCFDVLVSAVMLILLLPLFLVLAAAIRLDSPGKVLFLQERVTTGGKIFRIYKFRTMVENAEQLGSQVTVDRDPRITRVGAFLRKYRLDEIPQLLNILKGDMSFVGTRPEVMRYVECYTPEMMATLLLPAGVTSLASIYYKDEDRLLANAENADEVYVRDILPEKMKYNLQYLKEFNFWNDIKLLIMTVLAVLGKEMKEEENEGENTYV